MSVSYRWNIRFWLSPAILKIFCSFSRDPNICRLSAGTLELIVIHLTKRSIICAWKIAAKMSKHRRHKVYSQGKAKQLKNLSDWCQMSTDTMDVIEMSCRLKTARICRRTFVWQSTISCDYFVNIDLHCTCLENLRPT